MDFEIIGRIANAEVIAIGPGIRGIERLGKANQRELRGRARLAEVHWHEARGIGRKAFKRKRCLTALKLRRGSSEALPGLRR